MNRRGFIFVAAILLIPLAAVAVESVNELFRADVQRTHDEMIEAQLTQILLAGCAQANVPGPLDLPDVLTSAGAGIQIEMDNKSPHRQATVHATFEGHRQDVTILLLSK